MAADVSEVAGSLPGVPAADGQGPRNFLLTAGAGDPILGD